MKISEVKKILDKIKLEKKPIIDFGRPDYQPAACYGYNQAIDEMEAKKKEVMKEIKKGEIMIIKKSGRVSLSVTQPDVPLYIEDTSKFIKFIYKIRLIIWNIKWLIKEKLLKQYPY